MFPDMQSALPVVQVAASSSGATVSSALLQLLPMLVAAQQWHNRDRVVLVQRVTLYTTDNLPL